MYARSILAMLAAIATLVLVATPGQAMPAVGLGDLGTTTVVTRAGFEICEVCQVVEGDEDDEELDPTDLLLMGVDLF